MEEENQEWNNFIIQWLLDSGVIEFTIRLVIALAVVTVLIAVSKYLSEKVRKKVIENSWVEEDEYSSKMGDLMWTLTFYVALVMSLFLWLQIIWFDIGVIIWGLTVGLWFAFKEILWNMLAGILILATKEFHLWDAVEIDAERTYYWIIEEITMRYTVIRALNERRIIVPNLTILTYPVTTFTSEDRVRLNTSVVIGYDVDIDHAKKIAFETLESLENVVDTDEAMVWVNDISKSGDMNWVELLIIFFVEPGENIKWPNLPIAEVNEAIYKAFKENGITIPYPHTSVTVDKNDKNLLGSALYLMKNNKKQ